MCVFVDLSMFLGHIILSKGVAVYIMNTDVVKYLT